MGFLGIIGLGVEWGGRGCNGDKEFVGLVIVEVRGRRGGGVRWRFGSRFDRFLGWVGCLGVGGERGRS